MVLSIFATSIIFYLFLLFSLIAVLLLSNIALMTIIRNGKPFVYMVLITALYHLIFSARDSDVLFNLFGFKITEGGVYLAGVFSLRVLAFVGIAFFVSLTTLPSDMAEAMVGWLKPLGKTGLPVNDLGLIVFIAMRFIPVLAEEFDTIKKAQIMRGVDFSGSLIKRGRKMVYLLIPVFQSAIRRADDLAIAIESRGYTSGAERSSYRSFKWLAIDWIFIIILTGLSVTAFIITRD
jgi:energy-coupling factor transport system permease protein